MSTFLLKSTSETIIRTDVDLNSFRKVEVLTGTNFDVFGKIVIDSDDVIDELVNSPNVIENELIVENFLAELRVITVNLEF